jgi:hypothetical protein
MLVKKIASVVCAILVLASIHSHAADKNQYDVDLSSQDSKTPHLAFNLQPDTKLYSIDICRPVVLDLRSIENNLECIHDPSSCVRDQIVKQTGRADVENLQDACESIVGGKLVDFDALDNKIAAAKNIFIQNHKEEYDKLQAEVDSLVKSGELKTKVGAVLSFGSLIGAGTPASLGMLPGAYYIIHGQQEESSKLITDSQMWTDQRELISQMANYVRTSELGWMYLHMPFAYYEMNAKENRETIVLIKDKFKHWLDYQDFVRSLNALITMSENELASSLQWQITMTQEKIDYKIGDPTPNWGRGRRQRWIDDPSFTLPNSGLTWDPVRP